MRVSNTFLDAALGVGGGPGGGRGVGDDSHPALAAIHGYVDNVGAKLLIVTTTRSPPSVRAAEWDLKPGFRMANPGRRAGSAVTTLIERAI